jgi:D-alanyl-D-alanine carboxypeptidase
MFLLLRPRLRVAVVGAVVGLVAGCGTAEAPTAPTAPTALATAPAPSAAPDYAATLQPKLEQLVRDMSVTGAVVLVRTPDRGNWTTTIGTGTYRGNDPVRVDDHIRVGSNTKTWTGTVILQLVGEGRLRLSDPVATYRPDVPNGANITIEQLLNMRSGLYNYTESLELNQALDTQPGRVWAPEELVQLGLSRPPYFPPGTGFHYSNTNTVLLGLIAEQVTGRPLREEFRTRVFDPLGLTGTEFPEITSAAIPDPHPQGYTYAINAETIDSTVLAPEVQAAARAGTLAPKDVTSVNPSWGWSAGAGISTAEDLARYVEALVGGQLLPPAIQRQRLDSVVPIDPSNPQSAAYGLALARFGSLYGHSGELPGFNSFMGHDPDRKITVVTWASLAPAPDGRGPAVELAKAVIGELYAGQLPQQPPDQDGAG